MRKPTLIQTLLAASAVALSVSACTVSRDANTANNTANDGSTNTSNNASDGINVHFGDGSVNVDTPLFKMNKAGHDDKLHVEIPNIRFEAK